MEVCLNKKDDLIPWVINTHYKSFPSFSRLNHDLLRNMQTEINRNQYCYYLAIINRGTPEAREFDRIIQGNKSIYIKNVISQDITPERITLEFEDFQGKRHSWNSETDDGIYEMREEGVINATEKVDTRMFYKSMTIFFMGDLSRPHYSSRQFDADIHNPDHPGVVTLVENEDGPTVYADVYDKTIFIEIPPELQMDEDRLILKSYPTLNRMSYELCSNEASDYAAMGWEALDELEFNSSAILNHEA